MKIQTVDINTVKVNPDNPRIIKDEAFDKLVKSVSTFQKMLNIRPIVVDNDMVILGGNMRYEACKVAGLKTIPIIVADDLTDEEKKEFIIKDNISGGEWDWDKLANEWDSQLLIDWGFQSEFLHEKFDDVGGSDEDENYKTDKEAPKEDPAPDEIMNLNIWDFLRTRDRLYVQFSGGKDSMAQVAAMIDNGIDTQKMIIVHNSTPNDYPDLKDFVIDFAEKINAKEYHIIGDYSEDDAKEIFTRNGFPLQHMVWCTSSWKIQPMRKWFKELSANEDKNKCAIVQGWRKEESERREQAYDRIIDKNGFVVVRPIMDMSTDEVFEIIKKHKWQLHKSYEYRGRLSCLYCFAIPREEWDGMREKDPENFFKALKLVCHGASSHNIKGETFKNTIRKMMGMPTMANDDIKQ